MTMAEEIERIYIVPLKKIGVKSSTAAPTAVKRVKQYLTRHMKVVEKDIWIDDSLNNALWSKGKYHIPSKIRIKAVKFDDGVVEAYLPETGFTKSRRELLKEEKGKKAPILRREEEEEPAGSGEEAGTGDYEIAPTADGDVKIKKKKAPKEKKEEPAEKPTKEKEEKQPKPPTKKTGAKKKPEKKTTSTKTKKKKPAKKTTKKTSSRKKKTATKKKSD